MTSLDDTIISYQNIMLLDNMTNYNKPAIDYFHHEFNDASLEMSASWTLLLKMRKHKLLRLPSCSSEDVLDYNMYLVRLHHCLWRRWSINHYGLQNSKSNPLSINWNKETDVTVLYGPDLLQRRDSNENEISPVGTKLTKKQKNLKICSKENTECWVTEEVDEITRLPPRATYNALAKLRRIFRCPSSVDSHTSSISTRHSLHALNFLHR
ncbi:CBM_HP2_G0028260.mRNA.1.CDS.1 [Saccharomyces cerevisiae]|nr:CBM_HP2_G0028260.mRNA.1.CDS.1 [Saccharomyces cerevisiae]CAI6631206.1 CBM_HP2_G0028260.mRNA.1.CDS.1 [Saccharomyces cerevisiae]